MTRGAVARRVSSGFVVALAALLAVALSPPEVGAQEGASLEEYQLQYESALRNYEGAVAARDAVRSRFERVRNELLEARRAGGDQANPAWSALMDANNELNRMRRRVELTLEQLEEAGTRFLKALDTRREELATRAENLPSGARAEAEELTILLVDLTNQIDEVDAQLTEAREPFAPAAPEIVAIDPEDTQEDLVLKAQILEGYAAQYDSTLEELDDRLEQLRERQRTDRRVRDVLAPLDRFDERQLPVVPRRFRGGEGGEVGAQGEPPADTAAVGTRPLTLEARIENLTSLRERFVGYRDAVREQARFIRRRINQDAPGGRFA